ncbi:MAG: epoxyqueuosine reductase [Euryarchaeota archaeon]|nr:epoxyqueuosine reductase [Euryarchaeota archaeon]
MALKEEIKTKALTGGFQLFGVSDINKMEEVGFPAGRGLARPSEIMPEAKSLIVMGMVIWDEGMNAAISTPGTGDFSGGEAEYYNLYYETVETRAWRVAQCLWENNGIKAIPTPFFACKSSCTLCRIGFHRSQHSGHNP